MREIEAGELKKGDIVLDDGGPAFWRDGAEFLIVTGIRRSMYEVEITVKYKGYPKWTQYYPSTKIKVQ